MMEVDYFDHAIEGTTLKDCLEPTMEGKVIVVDNMNNYGTTYTSIDKLSNCKYIENFKVVKKGNNNIVIEAFPQLFFLSQMNSEKFSKREFDLPIDYVYIENVFFIDRNLRMIKVPSTKTDIVTMTEISDVDRFYLYKSIKSNDLNILTTYLTENMLKLQEESFLYKIFCKYQIFNSQTFSHYSKGFEKGIFAYPEYGISSIVESICFNRSVNGYTFLLNETIDIKENQDEDEYKYKITCCYGTIYVKNVIKQSLKHKTTYIKLLELNKEVLDGNFVVYLEADELITIIGLNHKAKVCEEGHQLLYLISSESQCDIKKMSNFNIKKSDIITDISFKLLFDLDCPTIE